MGEKQIIDKLLEQYKDDAAKSDLKAQNKALIKEVDRLKSLLEVHISIPKPRKPLVIEPYVSNKKDEAVALAVHSDVHIEKRITKEETNGLNFYNPSEAARRIKTSFVNLVKLITNQSKEIEIPHLVLAMLGDIIHGYIHEEYLPSNYMTPIEATIYAYDVYSDALKQLEALDVKDITVICKVGNHSRTTKKTYTQGELRHSYEYQLYTLLAKRFPDFKWIIEDNYATYFKIYDKTLRFHHGHAFTYSGGIGGIFPSMLRWIAKQNETRVADLDVMGHWHTTIRIQNALVNNAVCGADAYSIKRGFKAEEPTQQFLLIDKKRGFTANFPIILR